MTGRRRTVVTGIGAVTPLGNDLGATVAALAGGASAVRPLSGFTGTPFGTPALAAEVTGFDPRPHFRVPKALKLTDRRTRFAVAAAAMAAADARADRGTVDFERLGVVLGSSGSDLSAEDLARAIADDPDLRSVTDIPFFARRILAGLNPLWLLVNLPNMVSAHVAIQLEARGPNSTVMTDWIAGTQAVAEACRWIEDGEADAVLAGGADCGVLPRVFAEYAQAGLLGDGFVLAEGAAVLVLEERAAALRRGARLYGEIRGSGGAGDGGEGGALANALRRALDAAGWDPTDIIAVGLGAVHTAERRRAETDAIATLGAGDIPVREVTSRLGHALGAAGAIDLALMLKSPPAPCGRFLCATAGFLGQAAALAVEVAPDGNGSV